MISIPDRNIIWVFDSNPGFFFRSDSRVMFYKVGASERKKFPDNWKKFSLELLLTLWMDYLNVVIDWGGLKLEMMRGLEGDHDEDLLKKKRWKS